MVGGERDPDIGQSDLVAEEVDEIGKFLVEIESHLAHLGRIWTDLMTKDVVGREADREQIGSRSATDVFVNH